MANVSFTASWNAVATATSYAVTWTINDLNPVLANVGAALSNTKVLAVVDGDVVKASVVAQNSVGDSIPGFGEVIVANVSVPDSPVVTVVQN